MSDPFELPEFAREQALEHGGTPPIDFNIELITTDEDIITLIKEKHPELADLLLPTLSRLNSLSYIDKNEKEWWYNEVELLIEEAQIEIDETDLKVWNFLKGLRVRMLFMINDAYLGHKSRSIRERRTVVGWEPPERQQKKGWFGR